MDPEPYADREALYEALLQAQSDLGDGVMLTDGGRVLWANDAYCALVGRERDDVRVPDRDLAAASRMGRQEVALLRPDGTTVAAEVNVKRLDAKERPLFVEIVRDVSSRSRTQAELEEARAELLQSEKLAALGTLVAGVAHELRTPLTYLNNNVYLMQQRVLREASRVDMDAQTVDEIVALGDEALRGVQRINRLVEDLRRFTRLRTGELAEEALSDVVEEAVRMFQAARRATVRVDLLVAPTPPLVLDRVQVQQIVLNLLENAADANPRDDRILVRTVSLDGESVLEVTDEGEGIPDHVQARMFDPFYTTKSSGTGLGLSIVRRIAQAHGVSVEVDSDLGRGTTFRLRFPHGK